MPPRSFPASRTFRRSCRRWSPPVVRDCGSILYAGVGATVVQVVHKRCTDGRCKGGRRRGKKKYLFNLDQTSSKRELVHPRQSLFRLSLYGNMSIAYVIACCCCIPRDQAILYTAMHQLIGGKQCGAICTHTTSATRRLQQYNLSTELLYLLLQARLPLTFFFSASIWS